MEINTEGININEKLIKDSFKMPEKISERVNELLTQPSLLDATPQEVMTWIELDVDNSNLTLGEFTPAVTIRFQAIRILEKYGNLYLESSEFEEDPVNLLLEIYISNIYEIYWKYVQKILEMHNN